ncbi:hypothetical protein CBM2589_A10230 [Cupriavidus taiwanensis]|uniref:Uncharacterized protein n=1 Tax=Cupriavidus taiwanensis TaxID=164546 RepID=A0A975X5A5_9BURK|nr:hypothetical protein CBM2589_A10230 [Cupriavidus taiwanensis]
MLSHRDAARGASAEADPPTRIIYKRGDLTAPPRRAALVARNLQGLAARSTFLEPP